MADRKLPTGSVTVVGGAFATLGGISRPLLSDPHSSRCFASVAPHGRLTFTSPTLRLDTECSSRPEVRVP